MKRIIVHTVSIQWIVPHEALDILAIIHCIYLHSTSATCFIFYTIKINELWSSFQKYTGIYILQNTMVWEGGGMVAINFAQPPANLFIGEKMNLKRGGE